MDEGCKQRVKMRSKGFDPSPEGWRWWWVAGGDPQQLHRPNDRTCKQRGIRKQTHHGPFRSQPVSSPFTGEGVRTPAGSVSGRTLCARPARLSESPRPATVAAEQAPHCSSVHTGEQTKSDMSLPARDPTPGAASVDRRQWGGGRWCHTCDETPPLLLHAAVPSPRPDNYSKTVK